MKSEVGRGQVIQDLKALMAGERSLNFIVSDILYLFCNVFFVFLFSLNVASWVTFHMLSLSTKALI